MTIKNICTNCQIVSTAGHDVVFSYSTPVLAIFDKGENGKMNHTRLWNGWSITTQKHINKALDFYGVEHINKKIWDAMPVETINI